MADTAHDDDKSSLKPDRSTVNPVLHVLVIGFHHRKGCQVEYSWPPVIPENGSRSSNLPAQWKHLPSLALPDGAHNYDADTCFFHLPDLEDPRKTIFGISCYRQIDASKLINKTEDITRTTVQKSVCVLSRLPLYGHIQVKMQLITQAYFREGDFDRLDLIHQTYDNLNSCLSDDMCHNQQLYVGLSARAFVQRFKERALVLFKLLLLERKVLLFQSPVVDLTSFLLTLLSLHPGMLERGLDESACVVPLDTPPLSLSPDCNQDEEGSLDPIEDEEVESEEQDQQPPTILSPTAAVGDIMGKIDGAIGYLTGSQSHDDVSKPSSGIKEERRTMEKNPSPETDKSSKSINEPSQICVESDKMQPDQKNLALNLQVNYRSASKEKDTIEVAQEAHEESVEIRHSKAKDLDVQEYPVSTNFSKICNANLEDFGLPLKLFTGGNLCHPYVSLSYLDTLTQPSVHGYIIGATNDLFLHRKGLTDVIIRKVDEDYRLDVQDAELKRALQLTTEDLRFTENLIQHVCDVPGHMKSEEPDVFLDGIGWEGGDEWVRAQFRFYIISLLRTVINRENPSQSNHFNATFIQMWKKTKNYRAWRRFRRQVVGNKDDTNSFDAMQEIVSGHPYAGNSKFFTHDISLHVKNAMTNTESGKRVSKAVASTGQAVSKGFSSAKSTLSSFSSLFGSKSSNSNNTNPTEESEESVSKKSPKMSKSTMSNMQNEINDRVIKIENEVTSP